MSLWHVCTCYHVFRESLNVIDLYVVYGVRICVFVCSVVCVVECCCVC